MKGIPQKRHFHINLLSNKLARLDPSSIRTATPAMGLANSTMSRTAMKLKQPSAKATPRCEESDETYTPSQQLEAPEGVCKWN